jgi:NADH-quinone oxidoreductase subunit L
MWIATLAIAGIWPFAGFFSKDEIIWSVGAWAGAENAPFAGLYTVYWVMALVAALLTAFYMTRLMVMTFHGPNRTGVEEEKHLHKAPAVMTVPLMILAVFSVFGGWINVPEAISQSFLGGFGALPMSGWLHHWLEPVTEAARHVQEVNLGAIAHNAPFGGGELVWALISTVVALVVVLVSARVVSGGKVLPASEAGEPEGFLARILYHKWYVDEIYDRIVVRPLGAVSRFSWRVLDQGVIDGTANALAYTTRGVGWIASLFQTGSVNTYAFFFTLGVLIILGVVAF